jgi:hypothetical protein
MLSSPHQIPSHQQGVRMQLPSSRTEPSFYDINAGLFDANVNSSGGGVSPHFSERTIASTASLMKVPSLVAHSVDPVPITSSRFAAMQPIFSHAGQMTEQKPQPFDERYHKRYQQSREPAAQKHHSNHHQQPQAYHGEAPRQRQRHSQYGPRKNETNATSLHSLNTSVAGGWEISSPLCRPTHIRIATSPVAYKPSYPVRANPSFSRRSQMSQCRMSASSSERQHHSSMRICEPTTTDTQFSERSLPEQAWPTVEQYCRTCESCPCTCRSKRMPTAAHGQYITTSAAMNSGQQHALASSPLSVPPGRTLQKQWNNSPNNYFYPEEPTRSLCPQFDHIAGGVCQRRSSHHSVHRTSLPRGRPNVTDSVVSLLQPDCNALSADADSHEHLSRRRNLATHAQEHQAELARMHEEAKYLREHRQFGWRGLCESDPIRGVEALITPGGAIWRYEAMLPRDAPKSDYWHELPHAIQDNITAYAALPERRLKLANKLNAEMHGLQAEFQHLDDVGMPGKDTIFAYRRL